MLYVSLKPKPPQGAHRGSSSAPLRDEWLSCTWKGSSKCSEKWVQPLHTCCQGLLPCFLLGLLIRSCSVEDKTLIAFAVRYLRRFNSMYKRKAKLPLAVRTVDWPICGSDIGMNGTNPHCSSVLILLIYSDCLENTYLALLPQLPSNGTVTLSNNLPAMDCL